MSDEIEKKEWYYQKGGEVRGPFSESELAELAATGMIVPDTLVQKEGKQWAEARLFRLLPLLATAIPEPCEDSERSDQYTVFSENPPGSVQVSGASGAEQSEEAEAGGIFRCGECSRYLRLSGAAKTQQRIECPGCGALVNLKSAAQPTESASPPHSNELSSTPGRPAADKHDDEAVKLAKPRPKLLSWLWALPIWVIAIGCHMGIVARGNELGMLETFGEVRPWTMYFSLEELVLLFAEALPGMLVYSVIALILAKLFSFFFLRNGKAVLGTSWCSAGCILWLALPIHWYLAIGQYHHEWREAHRRARHERREADQALHEIETEYSRFVESSVDSQGFARRMEPIDTTPKFEGTSGEVERFLKEVMNHCVSQRNDYLVEIDAIGWNKILDPQRIARDTTLAESKATVRKAKEIVKRYKEKTDSLLADTRQEINALNLSTIEKADMTQAFDRGMQKCRHQLDGMWELENEIVLEVEEMIDLLSRNRGKWFVSEEQLLFLSDDDATTYNSHLASINDLVAEQEQLRRSSVHADTAWIR